MALSRSGTSNSQRLQQQRQIIQQLKELRKVSSAQRVGEWCTAVTRAMLDQPEKLKGVIYKCNDNVTVGAHRFVLGVQSTYFMTTLYRKGVINIEENCLMNKMYPFQASSKCFKYLREFLYTGVIEELEHAKSLEPHMPDIGELLEAARKPKRDHLGGADTYLARILCRKPPSDLITAVGRLSLGHIHSMPEIVEGMKKVVPRLTWDVDCFKKCRHVNIEVMNMVLREVPLPATELDVCRAVEQWALSYYGDDLDDSSPDLPEEEEPIIPNDDDRAILDHIDLSCIKSIDIKTIVVPMRLFSADQIINAQRRHAIHKTGNLESRVNPNRGL